MTESARFVFYASTEENFAGFLHHHFTSKLPAGSSSDSVKLWQVYPRVPATNGAHRSRKMSDQDDLQELFSTLTKGIEGSSISSVGFTASLRLGGYSTTIIFDNMGILKLYSKERIVLPSVEERQRQLQEVACNFKVNKERFTLGGPIWVSTEKLLKARDFENLNPFWKYAFISFSKISSAVDFFFFQIDEHYEFLFITINSKRL